MCTALNVLDRLRWFISLVTPSRAIKLYAPTQAAIARMKFRLSAPQSRQLANLSVDKHTIRLNLGCGSDLREGWVNVDARPTGDVVADVRSLPFKPNCAESILALDILEHFWRDQTVDILKEWGRVLIPGGTLILRVPNLWWLARALLSTREDLQPVVENVYGGHKYGTNGEFDTHHWGWTPISLETILSACGYQLIANDHKRNMTLICVNILSTQSAID